MTKQEKWEKEWEEYIWNSPWLRSPRTTAEMRMNAAPEIKEYVRSKRNMKNLPNSYDDIWIPHEKSWKARTKFNKQYKKNLND